MKYLKIAIVALLVVSCNTTKYKNIELEDGVYADIQTNKGDIILKLYSDETPLTVANFVSLAEGDNPKLADSLKGKEFYDGIKFHRVIKDFMIQGGDPTGTGRGNPGYKFADEFPRDTTGNLIYKHDKEGVLSMANGGSKTNGSQFFITHKATPWLDGKHTVFGKVVEGQGVVDSIAQNDTIKHVEIVRIGRKAKNFDAPKVFEEELVKADEREKEEQAKKAAADKARQEKFKADQKEFESKMDVAKATKTESGLKILKLNETKGKKVVANKETSMHYTIYLANGKKIQSSRDRNGVPFTFRLDDKARPMIPGVKEGMLKMREGEKVRLFIPYYLAYGERGGGPFPPKADVVFDVEVIKVGK